LYPLVWISSASDFFNHLLSSILLLYSSTIILLPVACNIIMDATNQPPKPYPPAPTVEDESDSTPHNTANMDRDMPDAPQAPTVPADTPQANATPDKNTTTGEAAAADSSTNPAEPRTPANKDPTEPPSDRVQIVLKDQGGNQIAFGVKSSTRMEKVQNAYAEKTGRPLASLRFYYEGARVLPDDTVATVSSLYLYYHTVMY
jgi:hypothetical protein